MKKTEQYNFLEWIKYNRLTIYIYIYIQETSDKIEEKKLISTFEGKSGYKLILQLPMITRIYIIALSP